GGALAGRPARLRARQRDGGQFVFDQSTLGRLAIATPYHLPDTTSRWRGYPSPIGLSGPRYRKGTRWLESPMDLLIFIFALCVFAFLAARFGVDSRDLGLAADEARLARLGMTWGTPARLRHVHPRAYALRHPLALAL